MFVDIYNTDKNIRKETKDENIQFGKRDSHGASESASK